MYLIQHLPTKTHYGLRCLKSTKSEHTIVCFRTYEEALHVGNSIATFYKKNKSYPKDSKVYILDKSEITSDALDIDLYVTRVNMEEPLINKIFGRNLNLKIMTDIFNDGNHSIDFTNSYKKTRFIEALEEDLKLTQ